MPKLWKINGHLVMIGGKLCYQEDDPCVADCSACEEGTSLDTEYNITISGVKNVDPPTCTDCAAAWNKTHRVEQDGSDPCTFFSGVIELCTNLENHEIGHLYLTVTAGKCYVGANHGYHSDVAIFSKDASTPVDCDSEITGSYTVDENSMVESCDWSEASVSVSAVQ